MGKQNKKRCMEDMQCVGHIKYLRVLHGPWAELEMDRWLNWSHRTNSRMKKKGKLRRIKPPWK